MSTGFSVLSIVTSIAAALNLAAIDFFSVAKDALYASNSASVVDNISAAASEEISKTGASFAADSASAKAIRSFPKRCIIT